MYRYLFATKGQVIICVRYTASVATRVFDLYHDDQWKLSPCEEMYYEGKMDRFGGRVQTKAYDANTEIKL
jgi:hypothetical protein